MVMNSLKMINAKLQFLHRQNEFLNPNYIDGVVTP